MSKLRHIAMVVEEMEKTAQFYEKAFEMKRVRQSDTAIGLSDGVVSLVIIHPSNVNMKGDDRRGLHHLGFLVEDVKKESDRVMNAGAKLHGAIIDSSGGTEHGTEREHKFKDPNGQIFDLTTPGYARDVWQIKV
jgi:catechol 2,3-dioxygenase-like lactoylglutathione lyase family enzyme